MWAITVITGKVRLKVWGRVGVWPTEIWRCFTEHNILRDKMGTQPIGIVLKLHNQKTSRMRSSGTESSHPDEESPHSA